MTRARREPISLEATSYYHCICRCVRRAFLCGEDSLTGKNYEHRKLWVVYRSLELQHVSAVDTYAYAVSAGARLTPIEVPVPGKVSRRFSCYGR